MTKYRRGRGGQLTPRQERFVILYCRYLSPKRAAIGVGYSRRRGARTGYELLGQPAIRDAVEERLKRYDMGKDEVIARLARIARGTLEDFITMNLDGRTVTLDLAKAEQAGKMGLLKELGYDGEGNPRVKLHDAHAALRDLARILGMFVDRREISGPQGRPVPLQTLFFDESTSAETLWGAAREARVGAIGAPEG
jgi:phage terminase small subunit